MPDDCCPPSPSAWTSPRYLLPDGIGISPTICFKRSPSKAGDSLTPAAPATPVRRASAQTTAQDIALLEAKFPWLRGAENQLPRDPPARGRVQCDELVGAIWPTSGTL
jgi:hypothetical protein